MGVLIRLDLLTALRRAGFHRLQRPHIRGMELRTAVIAVLRMPAFPIIIMGH